MFRKSKATAQKSGGLTKLTSATTGWFKRQPKWLRFVIIAAAILAAPTVTLAIVALVKKLFTRGAAAATRATKRYQAAAGRPRPVINQKPAAGTSRDSMAPSTVTATVQ